LLFELTLAAAGRKAADPAKGSVHAAVTAAKHNARYADLNEARGIFSEVRALRQGVASLWEILQFNQRELRTWVERQVAAVGSEEIRARLEFLGCDASVLGI
jgi:hypothetical protein